MTEQEKLIYSWLATFQKWIKGGKITQFKPYKYGRKAKRKQTPEERKAKARAYYWANKERCLALARRWRENNRDAVKSYNKRHYIKDLERKKLRAQARRARMRLRARGYDV